MGNPLGPEYRLRSYMDLSGKLQTRGLHLNHLNQLFSRFVGPKAPSAQEHVLGSLVQDQN